MLFNRSYLVSDATKQMTHDGLVWHANVPECWHLNFVTYIHCEPEKHTKILLSYLPQNSVDSDKRLYTLCWMNLRYSSLNVFQLTWIMSLHYLAKVSVAFCKWTATGTANPNTHQMFLSHRLQNQADSDKILQLLSWIYLPQSIVTVSVSPT